MSGFICEYDHTNKVDEGYARKWFSENFFHFDYDNTLRRMTDKEWERTKFVSEVNVPEKSQLSVFDSGRYLSLIFNAGFSGETIFYYENLDI